MAISKQLDYVHLRQLKLDPQNPRLRRDKRRAGLEQDELLVEMSNWTLDELVDSFERAGGFWTQDALIVTAEPCAEGEEQKYLVIEGNRRVAALKMVYGALDGQLPPPHWLAEKLESFRPAPDDELFTSLPILVADTREDVAAYLGFRHVTGIKQWKPAEKAEFITNLVDEHGHTYKEVAREIGSRSDTVRQNYTAFKMLLQMEAEEGFDWSEVEERFSVLFLSIRSEGTREFLGVELKGDRPATEQPIPEEKADDTKDFVRWLFGTKDERPIVKDSRNVDRFGEILAEPRAVEYLRTAERPDFETAYSLTTSADLVVEPLQTAARNIRLALSEIEGRADEDDVKLAAWDVIDGGVKLARITGAQNLDRAREMLLAA
jgi:hypothetical protein